MTVTLKNPSATSDWYVFVYDLNANRNEVWQGRLNRGKSQPVELVADGDNRGSMQVAKQGGNTTNYDDLQEGSVVDIA